MEVISNEVVKKISLCEAQDLSNASWAFTRLAIVHYKMLASLSEDATKKIHLFTAQNVTNTVWASGTPATMEERLARVNCIEALQESHEFCAQNFGNTLWAFSVCGLEERCVRDRVRWQRGKCSRDYDL